MPEPDRAQRERILHDLACPLTVIRAACLELGREENEPDRLHRLAVIDAQTDRLREGLAALRDVATSAHRPLGVADLVTDAVDRLSPVARAGGAVLTCTVGCELTVMGDAHRLARALDNLVVNALRHCRRRVVVSATPGAGGERITIRVADDGAGVPPAERDHVFREGWRGARGEGRGLGLAIASDVAREHGGRLRLLPSRGGATFGLDLPALAAARPALGAA